MNYIQISLMRFILLLFFSVISVYGITQTGSISGKVSDNFGDLAGAKVEILEIGLSKNCDVNGRFHLDLDPGTYTIRASYLMYAPKEVQFVISFSSMHPEINFVLKPGNVADEVVEIGTRFEPKSQLESPVAVDIISSEDLKKSPQTSLSQILMYLIPSFNSNRQTISDGTDHVAPSTIRGLGSDQFLVLINGKRRHSSSLVNVNGTVGRGSVSSDLDAIPISAIDRIELMRDGAGAQYGSDAIAGVINIILKEKTDDFSIQTSYQPTLEGDGTEEFLGASYGVGTSGKGHVNISAEMRRREALNRAGNYTGNVYTTNDSLDAVLIQENDFFSTTGYSDHRVMEIGAAQTFDGAVQVNAGFTMSENTEFYAHGGFNYRNGISHAFYRFPKDSSLVVEELYPNGFSPELHTDIIDRSGTVGIRGTKKGWLIDLSNTFGQNRLEYTLRNSNNASLGIASPTDFYAGGFIYGLNTTNVDISKVFKTNRFFHSIGVAMGAEFRMENYSILSGDEASWINGEDTLASGTLTAPAAQGFNGFQPQNELEKRRSGGGVYGDVDWNFTKNWLIETALRLEDYSDFGTNGSWKLATRYKWKEKWSLRGVFSTSFRAPSLQQVHFNNVSTQFVDGEYYQVGTFNNESAVSQAFGIGQLKAETSRNLSVGFTGKLFSGLTVNLDGFLTDIDNRIVLSGRFDTGYESTLNPVGAGAAQFMTNAISTRTYGFDFGLLYNVALNGGHIWATILYNHAQTEIYGDIQVSDEFIGDTETLINREERSRIEDAQPHDKIIATIKYDTKKWEFCLKNTYFGKVEYIHPEDGDPNNWVYNEFSGQVESRDQTFKAKLITDLGITYKINQSIDLMGGAHNLFNVYPDKHTHSANTVNGQFIYSRRVQQFGVRGAMIYLKVCFSL